MRLAMAVLFAVLLVAACVGQAPAAAPSGEIGTSDIDDLGNELNSFGDDVEELSVPDVDLTVP